MDAANMLKPALARGELRSIGATTLDEYRKHIEKDAALERRFQPVMVGEPSCRGHHRDPARPEGALRGAPRGAHPGRARSWPRPRCRDRYITDRFLPDKAIDLIDEAGSRAAHRDRLDADGDRRRRAPHHAARDRAAGPGEGDRRRLGASGWAPSRGARRRCASEADALQGPLGAGEGGHRRGSASIKEQLEKARTSGERPSARATSSGAARAALRHPARAGAASSTAPTTTLAELQAEPQDAEGGGRRGGHRRGGRQVDRHPGLAGCMEGEVEKLLQMEDASHERVVGQDERRRGGRQRGAPRPRRAAGPEPPDRLVHLPGPHRRGQDGAGPGAGRVPLRRRARHGPHRHVRVHGEAHRGPADRRASGLRGLRGGRPAHRGGAPPAVRGGAASTRSRRPTRTSSTCCCRSWTTAASPTARAARWTSRTRSSS